MLREGILCFGVASDAEGDKFGTWGRELGLAPVTNGD